MNARARTLAAVLLALGVIASGACYGTGTAHVGVYGPSVYGPGAWGAYPYPGRYPPMGGGVWIGAPRCCEEEQDEEQTSDPEAETTQEATKPEPDRALVPAAPSGF